MIDQNRIEEIINESLQGTDMFLVEIRQSPSNEIEITIDSDTAVGIDACVTLNRAINEVFDREQEDFELTVMSAGIGRPLRLLRQYQKLIGREVEVVLMSGNKLTALLTEASEQGISIRYKEKVAVEGKKRKVSLEREQQVPFNDIKSVSESFKFKG